MDNLKKLISKKEIEIYKDVSGSEWNFERHEKNKELFGDLLDRLNIAVLSATQKLWGSRHLIIKKTKILTQPSPKIPRFQKYLAITIGLPGKYSEIIKYWIFIEGSRSESSFKILLGIKDKIKSKPVSKNFEIKATDKQKTFKLTNIYDIDDEINLENLANWIVDSIRSFSLSYEQFCSEMQPELDAELSRLFSAETNISAAEEEEEEEEEETSIEKISSINKDSFNQSTKNIILYGPPGTGKTYRLQELGEKYRGRSVFVTFHQSYGYEEFVEGLRPVLIDDENSLIKSSDGVDVKYKIEAGIFKKLCNQARQDPKNDYAIFIDEINRGNISKIFGELITLIELDKRSDPKKKQEQQFQVSLAYSKEPFTVPANVSIIGSMNTADRSLALIDTALRRRFEFRDLYPDTRETKVDNDPFSAPLAGLMVGSIDVRRMLECMNERIEVLYDRDHCIGHAYFTGLIDNDESTDAGNKFDKFRDIFFNRIKPLLEEYFFDDWEKIGRVLGDHLKKESRLQFLKKLPLPKDLRDFEDNSDNSKIFLRPRYRWNDNAFSDPGAYIGIYSQS